MIAVSMGFQLGLLDVLCLHASLESFLEPGIGLEMKECPSDTSPLKDL